jgi:hypothetical protein
VLCIHGLTGTSRSSPTTILGVIDEYQVMLKFDDCDEMADQ